MRSFRDNPRSRIDAKQRGEMAGMSHLGEVMNRRACTVATKATPYARQGLKKNEGVPSFLLDSIEIIRDKDLFDSTLLTR